MLGFSPIGGAAIGDPGGTMLVLVAGAGSFVLTGGAATFQITEPAASGSFTLTGEAALFQEQLVASCGLFTLTGDAPLQIQEHTEFGTFTLTGESIDSHLEIAGGSSSSAQRFDLVPYGVAKRKPYRPVWDKPRQGEIERPSVKLPPAGIFVPGAPPAQMFAPAVGVAPEQLPRFDHLAAPDPSGLDGTLRDALDQGDAQAALEAFARQQQARPPAPAVVAAPQVVRTRRGPVIPPPLPGAPPDQHIRDAADIRDILAALQGHASKGEDQDMADIIAVLGAAGLIGGAHGTQGLPAGLG